jgi:deoxyribonuclease V
VWPGDFPLPDLAGAVWELVNQIPRGNVATYADLARALGDERARSARWLGELLVRHPHDEGCLCHRVVRSTGEVGLYVSGDSREKADRLREEGVSVTKGGRVDLDHRFTGFRSSRPLEKLRTYQRMLGDRMRQVPLRSPPETLAGIDVAYPQPGQARGAYVELDAATLQILREVTVSIETSFPYIPGYLAFRELPVMLAACREAMRDAPLADLLFVDGNGLLHPWRAGIAVCLGVLLDHPTLGIGKSLLCGSVDVTGMSTDEFRPVLDGEEPIGVAVRSNDRSRPVYASPGHRITLEEAGRWTRHAMSTHRLPEPIHHADRATKKRRP